MPKPDISLQAASSTRWDNLAMPEPAPPHHHHQLPDIVLPDESPAAVTATGPAFDANSTTYFQARMSKAPAWFCSFIASNRRENRRFRDELAHMRGAWPLLMKQRNGGTWTPDDKNRLKAMVRSASSVSPYLFIWAIPGSMLLLPFLAWFLDRQRKRQMQPGQKAADKPSS